MIDFTYYERLFMDRSVMADEIGMRVDGNVGVASREAANTPDDVRMACIASGQSVIVSGKIIASEVIVGESSMPEQELGRLLGEINGQLQAMAAAVMQLRRHAAFNDAASWRMGLGPMLRLLCERQFATLPGLVVSLCQTAKANMRGIDKEWLILCHKLKKNFTAPYAADLATTTELALLAERVDRLHRSIAVKGGRSDCLLSAGYVQNSRLYSSGDIRIVGEGVQNASLYALGFVHIDGYARGSEVYAEQGVRIRKAGGRDGAQTRIRVPAGKSVIIDHALAGTIIQIGSRMHTVVRESDLYIG